MPYSWRSWLITGRMRWRATSASRYSREVTEFDELAPCDQLCAGRCSDHWRVAMSGTFVAVEPGADTPRSKPQEPRRLADPVHRAVQHLHRAHPASLAQRGAACARHSHSHLIGWPVSHRGHRLLIRRHRGPGLQQRAEARSSLMKLSFWASHYSRVRTVACTGSPILRSARFAASSTASRSGSPMTRTSMSFGARPGSPR